MDKDKLAEIEQDKKRWEEVVSEKRMDKGDALPAALDVETQPIYTPLDIAGFDYKRDSGFPGEFPYLRGIYPTVYRGQLWNVAEYAGFGTPDETNQRYPTCPG